MHLIITEKHDTAKRIAAILSEKKPKKERISGVDTYKSTSTICPDRPITAVSSYL
jgi:DNA topoisomerase-1